MTDRLTLPPATATSYQTALNRYTATPAGSRNYPRWLAELVAGFVAPEPPTVTPDTAGLPGAVTLADVLDDAAEASAATGIAWLRPVNTPDGWTLEVLDPSAAAAEWTSRRHGPVTVWTIQPDPRRPAPAALAVVETYPGTPDTPIDYNVWEGTLDPAGRFTADRQVDVDNPPAALADHPFIRAANRTPRRIIPMVAKWFRGRPAPIYEGAAELIDGLNRLNAQEQDDAEMARHRVAISSDLLATDPIQANGHTFARPGFRKDQNLLVLRPGLTAQGSEDLVKPITFPDSLTQRDRIERRENTLLEHVGIAPQSIGRSVHGRSDSAAAKRADSQLTVQTATRLARSWSTALSEALTECHRLNTGSTEPVTVTLHPGLTTTLAERAETVIALRDTAATSLETRIRALHPDWPAERIDAELEAVQQDRPLDTLD